MEENEVGDDGKQKDKDDPLPPRPAEGEEKELLFLIEFLVDKLLVRMENLDLSNMDPCLLQGQNCMEVTFLHFPPICICEKDINTEKLTGDNESHFKCGKSLTFAITESQFEEPPPVFVKVSAHKELPHEYQPRRLFIGQAKINITKLFKLLFDKYDENPTKVPISKSIKDKYILKGEKDPPTAEVEVYIRLTCLGENVVTEFQTGEMQCDPMLFKNKESTKIYECKSKENARKGGMLKTNPSACDRPKKNDLDLCRGPPGPPPPDQDDENFEEIFAEINGAAISIKVEKSKRKGKTKLYHVSEFCDCDIPLSGDLVQGVSQPSFHGQYKGGSSEGEIPEGKVGLKDGREVVFPVPAVSELVKPGGYSNIAYNVNTCLEGEKHGHKGKNSYKIITGTEADNVPKLPNDPEKDVFTLKIIKRGRNNKGKGTLELEFKTPKEKIAPPPKPPYMISREVGPEKDKKKKKK